LGAGFTFARLPVRDFVLCFAGAFRVGFLVMILV
jgi:hypothetical protein